MIRWASRLNRLRGPAAGTSSHAPATLDAAHADVRRFPPPSWVVDDLAGAIKDGSAPAYPSGHGDEEVLDLLSPALSDLLGVSLDPATEVLLTAGTQGGLFVTLSALIENGDVVAIADPDYLATARTVRYLGAEPAFVPITNDHGRPQLDTGKLAEVFARGARLLVFSHPNNPSGAVLPSENLRRIAQLAIQFDALVVADELYSRVVYDDLSFTHLISVPGMRGRCVTTIGPSKAESMTGFRIGVVVAPPQIVDAAAEVQSITTIRAPAYGQWTLRHWLRSDQDFLTERRRELQLLRDLTVERFDSTSVASMHTPQGGTFAFVEARELGIPAPKLRSELADRIGLRVVPGTLFGPSGEYGFRLCFAQDERRWDRALTAMIHCLEQLAARRIRGW